MLEKVEHAAVTLIEALSYIIILAAKFVQEVRKKNTEWNFLQILFTIYAAEAFIHTYIHSYIHTYIHVNMYMHACAMHN